MWPHPFIMPVFQNIPTQPETINPVVSDEDVTNEVVNFLVHGRPLPKERPRMALRRSGSTPGLYNPSLRHERHFVLSVRLMMGLPNNVPLFFNAATDLHVSIRFGVPRPDLHFIVVNHARNLSLGFVQVQVSGDNIDKLVKLVLDALNDVLYKDDNQVIAISAMKHWASDHNSPGSTTVAIWLL